MGEAQRLAPHPLNHVVATDPGIGARALGHHGRAVVRAAGAEPRQALGDVLGVVGSCRGVEHLARLAQPVVVDPLLGQQPAQLARDQHRVERFLDREDHLAVLGLPAQHAPALAIVEDRLLDLDFQQLALFLDADDQVEPLGPFLERQPVERPDHADLVGGDAQRFGLGRADAQQVERVHGVEPALARRDDADLRPRLAEDALVDPVRPTEGFGGETLVIVQPRLLCDGAVLEADVHTVLGHLEIVGRDDLHPVRVAVDDLGDLDRVLDAFEAHPAAGIAAERPAEDAVIQHLLHAGRAEDGHQRVDEGEFGMVQHRRGFAGVIVAHAGDHAAQRRGAGHVGMAEHVARAVDARPLRVPHAEDALMRALAAQMRLLSAPERRRGQILVQTGIEKDVMGFQLCLRADHVLIHPAQRRAAIAGDIAGGVVPRGPVANLLHHGQPHQRLDAAQQHLALCQIIAIRERYRSKLHVKPSLLPPQYGSDTLTHNSYFAGIPVRHLNLPRDFACLLFNNYDT